MLKHNILLFLRNVKKNKNIFLIKTIGLGVGIASFLMLSLFVHNDLTYNHFHENLSNIYRVREWESFQTKGPLLPKMLAEIPEVENGTRIFDWEEFRLSYEDVAFAENVRYVDSGFFSMFSFPFTEGSPKNAIKDKYDVVISTDFAQKYFGEESAIGKELQVKFEDTFLTVNGVVDIPKNSSIQFDIIASYETGEELSPWIKDIHDWYNTFSETYVQLADGTTPTSIKPKLQRIVSENYLPVGENETDLNLLPFSEYHSIAESNRTFIVILALIAIGILGIAIVNFINLTITDSLKRTKEIGIKKVHGATEKNLFWQIIVESLLVGLSALVFGIFLLVLLLPSFNNLFETGLQFAPFENSFILYVLLGIWLTIGLFSGIVPPLMWARGKLVDILHGKLSNTNKSQFSRYSSIIVQFAIVIILISGTFLIRKQIDFMVNKDPKFDNENVIITQLQSWQFPDLEITSKNYKRIAEELEASPYVESVSFSGNIPGTYQENYNVFYPQGKSALESIHLRKAYVGENYFKTFGIKLLSGHGFEKGSISHKNAIVLNRDAMNQLGYNDATGQVLNESSTTGNPNKVVGIVDDFSYQGVQRATQPLVHIFYEQEDYTNWGYLSIRAKQGASLRVIEQLKELWGNAFSGIEPNYFFSDTKLNEHYKEYIQINTLIAWFSILAIVLSCIGLFAVASFTMAKRTKEIGIRKVNGATIGQILSLLNIDFARWVGLAFIVAVPLSWYAMHKWLQGFAYKTTISWWIFALGGLTALFIALLTVSWQSFKAAIANPVEALRNE
ncbi:ABC transporter permease [Flagellimonas sp.]|uniref:ABC transporter permease n=1 Tax=Flagellimonas sp. TaxID=2058762 RepID=UPI003B5B0C76